MADANSIDGDCDMTQSCNEPKRSTSSPLMFSSWDAELDESKAKDSRTHRTPTRVTNSPALQTYAFDAGQFSDVTPAVGPLPPFRGTSAENTAQSPGMAMMDETENGWLLYTADGYPVTLGISLGGKLPLRGTSSVIGPPHPSGASLHTLEFSAPHLPTIQTSDGPQNPMRGLSGNSEGMMELALRELPPKSGLRGAPNTPELSTSGPFMGLKRQRPMPSASDNMDTEANRGSGPARVTRSSSRGAGRMRYSDPRPIKRRAVEEHASSVAVPQPSARGVATAPMAQPLGSAGTVFSEPARQRRATASRKKSQSVQQWGVGASVGTSSVAESTRPKYKYVKPKSLGGQSLLGLAEDEHWTWYENAVLHPSQGQLRQFAYWPPNSPVEQLVIRVKLPGLSREACMTIQYRGTTSKAGTHIRKGSAFACVEKPFPDGSDFVLSISSPKRGAIFLHQDRRLKRTNEAALRKGEQGHETIVPVFVQDTPITFAVKTSAGEIVDPSCVELQWQVEKHGKSQIFHRAVKNLNSIRVDTSLLSTTCPVVKSADQMAAASVLGADDDIEEHVMEHEAELVQDTLEEEKHKQHAVEETPVVQQYPEATIRTDSLDEPMDEHARDLAAAQELEMKRISNAVWGTSPSPPTDSREALFANMSAEVDADEVKAKVEDVEPSAMLALPNALVCQETASAGSSPPLTSCQQKPLPDPIAVDGKTGQGKPEEEELDDFSVASYETHGRILLYPKLIGKPMVGRHLSFRQLFGKLGDPDEHAATKIVNIYGRKGIGKTQFLQYYAHKMKNKYHSVLWLDIKHFQESWNAIVRSLNTTPAMARQAFQKHLFASPCSLLVVDRVDANARFMNCPFLKSLLEPEKNNSFMPQKGLHVVLISRVPLNWSLEVRAEIPLVPMKLPSLYHTSQELLERSVGVKMDPSVSKKVVGLLNHMPALIVNFSEHIRSGLLSVDQFMRQTFHHIDAVTLDPDKDPGQGPSFVLRCPAAAPDAERSVSDETNVDVKCDTPKDSPKEDTLADTTQKPLVPPPVETIRMNASKLVNGLASAPPLPEGLLTPVMPSPAQSPHSQSSHPSGEPSSPRQLRLVGSGASASDIDCFSAKTGATATRKCLPVNTRKSSTLYTLGLQDIFNKHPEYFNLAVLELCASVQGGSVPVSVIKKYNARYAPAGMSPEHVAEKVEDYMRLLAGIDIGKIRTDVGYESSFQLSKVDYHLIRRYIKDNEVPEETKATKARLFDIILGATPNDAEMDTNDNDDAE